MRRQDAAVGIAVRMMMMTMMIAPTATQAQDGAADGLEPRFSVSYELLEMSANRFRNFAGDIGYRLTPKSELRLVVMEVSLTESHLADDFWARIVTGGGVKGYMRGYEMNYDRFVAGGLYVMANAGYIDLSFESVDTGARYGNGTLSLGSGVGYKLRNLFGVKGLILNPSIPIRYFFDPVEETLLGTGTVQEIRIAPSAWVFIGFSF